MTEHEQVIKNLEEDIRRLSAWKIPPTTKIHYMKLQLSRLKENPVPKSRSKRSPRSPQLKKLVKPDQAKASPENRAYVLSGEIYDLTQAMVALERLR